MGAVYFTEILDIYRFFGLNVEVVAGWERRARKSGGFPSKVEVLWGHHTASGPASDGWPSVAYGTFNADAAPIANEYIDRTGKIWLAAAGATNTEGAGGPWHHVAKDAANAVSWSKEVMNNGVGEPYTAAQQKALLDSSVLFAVKCVQMGWWNLEEVRSIRNGTHFEWAPTRKIDLRGPSKWASGALTKWDYNQFRQDVYEGAKYILNPPPVPAPTPDPNPPAGQPLPWPPVNTEMDPIVWVPDMQQREQGYRVVQVQFCMVAHQGSQIECDGDYGPTTENHVRWWQATHGLPNTGIVDVTTARSLGLNAVPAPPPPVHVPDPPAPDVWIEPNPFFYLWSGARWSYTVAKQVWNNGNLYPHLDAANSPWPASGQHVRVPNGAGLPGIAGGGATVRAGDGPWAILKRIWPNDNPATRLDAFYKWNGGPDRRLAPGDRVFIPA